METHPIAANRSPMTKNDPKNYLTRARLVQERFRVNKLSAECLETVREALLDDFYAPEERNASARDWAKRAARVAIDAYEEYWASLGTHVQEGGKLP